MSDAVRLLCILLVPLLLAVLAVGFVLLLRPRPSPPVPPAPAEEPMTLAERRAIRAHALQSARHQWKSGRSVANPFATRPERAAYWRRQLHEAQRDIYHPLDR